MPDAPRPRTSARARAATTGPVPVVRRRTVLIGVLAIVAALLIPAVLRAAPAHAATGAPIGALDAVTISPDGKIRIQGWAADPDAPTTSINVAISDNGTVVATSNASIARADIASALPAYGPKHGYSYDLAAVDASHSICVTADNIGAGSDLQLGCRTITVHNNPTAAFNGLTVTGNTATAVGTASDPNTTGPVLVQVYRDGKYANGVLTDPSTGAYTLPVSVSEGSHVLCWYVLNQGAGANTVLGCRSVVIHNNPFGSLDSAAQNASGVVVTGWAIDLNTTAALTVRAWVDGTHVADATASRSYGGLAASYPTEGANHGYTFTLNLAQGTHQVCVSADNVSYGASQFIGCKTVSVRNNPIGALEIAQQKPGGIQLSGWALDFNTTSSIAVHVYVDGRYAAQTRAAIPRADVGSHYPNVGPNHGFSLTLPYTTGTHQICVYPINVGPGITTPMPCKQIALKNNPVGAVEYTAQYPGGVQISGWSLDPDTGWPITVQTYVDGRLAAGTIASSTRGDLSARYPFNGVGHGYAMNVAMAAGTHQVCTYALNVGPGGNTLLKCATVNRLINPVGVNAGISRVGLSDSVQFQGWAVDPNTLGAAQVRIGVDGIYKGTVAASVPATSSLPPFPLYGPNHGYAGTLIIGGGEHVVCTAIHNLRGQDIPLACARILSSGETVPASPTLASAWPGSHEVTLSWATPRSDNAPLTGYRLTVQPGNRVLTLSPAITTVVSHYLTNGTPYTFTLQGVNKFGIGSAVTVGSVPTNIPPQVTPAPVSTSHYVRNLTGNLSSDAAMMRSTGANDAAHNPSGHNYLVLLQIGGQDEADQGALLSATARFVTYPAVVSAMKAYLDGYATRQLPYAPLTLAIGTNNDVDVSTSAGISWARNVVNPVAAYAAAKYPGMIIAGANDMEPGFSASVAATRAWLSGYLSATTARFVFNGSADGCSTGVAGAGCNNGWRMSDLQWLAGGAAPTRTISLPQIYNYAMPLQWKYISLTGVNSGRSRINFGGPLTEATACAQAGGSCGSISNVTAWNQLWSAISSIPSIRQTQLPNGTDLRIN